MPRVAGIGRQAPLEKVVAGGDQSAEQEGLEARLILVQRPRGLVGGQGTPTSFEACCVVADAHRSRIRAKGA